MYDTNTYGDYGYWTISITADGTAIICNLGNSKGKYLQYNASNNPTLFSCYADLSQTPICIYREIQALDDVVGISASMVNFGNVILYAPFEKGSRKVTINANRLSSSIQCHLKDGSVFSLSDSVLDKNGGDFEISYYVSDAGRFMDTLVLESDSIVCETPLMMNVVAPMTIAEAINTADYTLVYFKEVVVTKKYDTYIFVRDATGSMLIYDTGDGTGHRYGTGLENGHVLTKIVGRVRNYFGVPKLSPAAPWCLESMKRECLPEVLNTVIDSSDVCRYVRLPNVKIENGKTMWKGVSYTIVDAFDAGMLPNISVTMDAIVMISWSDVQLWVTGQETAATTIDAVDEMTSMDSYNVLGQKVDGSFHGIVIHGCKKFLK